MPRIARFLFATSLVAVAAFAMAQTPPATPPAAAPTAPIASEYYPLKVGNVWVYKIDAQRTLEMKVDKIDAATGEATILTMASGRQVCKDTILVKKDSIVRTKINDLAITPPIQILALPPAKDASWDVNSKVQEKPIVGKMTIKGVKEKLKLADGKEYECVFVDGPDFKVDGSSTKMKIWFCAGKGIVKLSYETNQQEASLELSEFREGK